MQTRRDQIVFQLLINMNNQDDKSEKKKKEPVINVPIKKTSDLIKLKLDKLMNNFEKPVIIPERPKQKNGPSVPEFVRNVMGSSAGAGSGEFHVYRHLRRKEYARQKYIQLKSEAELKDDEYHQKLADNVKAAEEATAKKRAKRLKKKQKKKMKTQNIDVKSNTEKKAKSSTGSESESD